MKCIKAITFLSLFFVSMISYASDCNLPSFLNSLFLKDLSETEIAFTLSAIQTKNPERILSAKIIEELEKVAGLSPGDIAAGKFDPHAIVDSVINLVGKKHADLGIGQQLTLLANASEKTKPYTFHTPAGISEDQNDLLRGYGYMLLSRKDPIFKDPKYLHDHLRLAGQKGYSEWGIDDPTYAVLQFQNGWMDTYKGPVVPSDVFFQSGSDANNALFEIAKHAASNRLGKKIDDAEILFFEGTYSAGRGRMKENSFFKGDQSKNPRFIPAPYTPIWNPNDPLVIAELIKKEESALAAIRQKVSSYHKKPIGGIILEPIVGAYGVLYYRKEFLLKLRALCDELKIPIFADEVLNGGGRTGRFFAFEHYEGFLPDFVTYGKGFQLAGIAKVFRKNHLSLPPVEVMVGNYNTLGGNSEALLKGAAVMKKIRESKLIENADAMGKYFIEELKKIGMTNARGKGLLINPLGKLALEEEKMLWRVRFMPYMTINKEEIDAIITRLKNNPDRLH